MSDYTFLSLSDYEFENIVAFNGRLLYSENTPLNIDLEAELVNHLDGIIKSQNEKNLNN